MVIKGAQRLQFLRQKPNDSFGAGEMLHDGPTIGDFRQTGVSSGNAEREARLNARKSIVSDVIFPKSVLKSIFLKWPERQQKLGILS